MSNMPLTIPGFPHPDINNEREVEVLQFVEVPERSWNDANEVALGKPENLEVGKVPKLWRDPTREEGVIGDEGEDLEVLEGSEGVQDGAGEVVAGEVEVAEVGEERERGREETSEEVLGEVEVAEIAAEGDVERERLVDGVVQCCYSGVRSVAGIGHSIPVARGGVP
ncbi:unnamed protein product [Sphenostylis stenocarpa]|uniref:Uncharacterized protein n=1 Tax=Sphenostylis stenocarpa TaxID=92480 RepID=A0AA86SPV7_9FABA|nr:unnamed protein product [Sphenostylis stenocarpa]